MTSENFIRFSWFNDFQTHGIWLDGFDSYPVGFSSLICPQLLEKLKDLDCIQKLKASPAWHLINKSEIAYPRLVKLFYINLKLKKGKEFCLTSKAAGVDIELNHEVFSKVLGYDFKVDCDQVVDKKEIIKSAKLEFFNIQNPAKHQLTHSILEVEPKILFTIFMRCLIPKDNSKELLSDKVLYLMYLILHNYDLDLPKMVMEYMHYAAS